MTESFPLYQLPLHLRQNVLTQLSAAAYLTFSLNGLLCRYFMGVPKLKMEELRFYISATDQIMLVLFASKARDGRRANFVMLETIDHRNKITVEVPFYDVKLQANGGVARFFQIWTHFVQCNPDSDSKIEMLGRVTRHLREIFEFEKYSVNIASERVRFDNAFFCNVPKYSEVRMFRSARPMSFTPIGLAWLQNAKSDFLEASLEIDHFVEPFHSTHVRLYKCWASPMCILESTSVVYLEMIEIMRFDMNSFLKLWLMSDYCNLLMLKVEWINERERPTEFPGLRYEQCTEFDERRAPSIARLDDLGNNPLLITRVTGPKATIHLKGKVVHVLFWHSGEQFKVEPRPATDN